MPKMKTHSGAKKRIKVTGKGKLSHEQPNRRHNFENKPSKRTRKLMLDKTLTKGDAKKVKRLLGMR